MKNKNPAINSRVEISDPAILRRIAEMQKASRLKTKPQLELIIEEYFKLTDILRQSQQPQG